MMRLRIWCCATCVGKQSGKRLHYDEAEDMVLCHLCGKAVSKRRFLLSPETIISERELNHFMLCVINIFIYIESYPEDFPMGKMLLLHSMPQIVVEQLITFNMPDVGDLL